MRKAILLAVAALALAGCDYGQTRSSFQLKVAGKTLDEAIATAGKPRAPGGAPVRRDRARLRKDPKTGQFEYWGIEFVPEA